MQEVFAVTPGNLYRSSKPVRDEAYRAFIRKLPCYCCGATWGVEAAHTGPHGLGQKSSDLSCIPLCRKCHRTGNQSLHNLGPVRFAEVHGIDIAALIAKLNTFYTTKLNGSITMSWDRFNEEGAADLSRNARMRNKTTWGEDGPEVEPVEAPRLDAADERPEPVCSEWRRIIEAAQTVAEMQDGLHTHVAACAICQGVRKSAGSEQGKSGKAEVA